ncbi:receptor homology region, transmembrane domain- and RING domain-containing protein 1 isoform X2 [Magnolia sinica]|uniref:receptor homology region, transmembrane domain- and RING domain-containing protein 1 isoform X2 n=1 Tax=Magnolia sinica TaxID=86752 RepID=UPI0026586295|nr:receptor homology region, transmembrane domain- and RING domain-containing protein 1 isoform X2 [Magnolia sinica]
MKKYSFPVIIIVFSFVQISSAIVQFKTKSFSFSVIDAPAPFAVPVNRSGICGALYVANPPDACSSIRNNLPSFGNADHVRFALIVRGNCTFEEKVRNTQAAGFRAAIVYDDQDNHNLMSMIGKPRGIQVHAVFVSRRAGEILKMYAQGKDGECCISPLFEGTAWTVLVISMFSLVIIVSVLAILILSRNNRLQRQRSDHYSPTINAEIVRNLPCVTFHTACQNGNLMAESCAICLEVYRDGETLRVLPCQHALLYWRRHDKSPIISLEFLHGGPHFGFVHCSSGLILGMIPVAYNGKCQRREG